jgi:RNase P/RNase MRP subunit p29
MNMQKQAKPARTVLIGETIRIVSSKNKSLEGIGGKVTDETKNMLKIMTPKGEKTAIKDQITIKIGDKTINGEQIQGKIEARIKQ